MGKHLLKATTGEGYYIEIGMLLMSSTFDGIFNAKIKKNSIVFHQVKGNMMISLDIDGFDKFYADQSLVGREFVVETSAKNPQLSNNKKKDMASLVIERDNTGEPNKLVLWIKDGAGITTMDITYQLKNVYNDSPGYVLPFDPRYSNPTVITDSGEMTKSVKVIAKVARKGFEIQAEKKAIRMVARQEMEGISSVSPSTCVDIGRWDKNGDVLHTYNINKEEFKSIIKFYNLGKKVRIHTVEDMVCVSLHIASGLGHGLIAFKNTEPS